ncbi:MAG: cobalt-precorrin-6A reductase, partial [Acaryochloridaceae cyanobacterium CSU_5_19]|nr:cobalt-precorrin-6A reductase [Acaryochloridaceae cyanobacterium CSU_5_19]
ITVINSWAGRTRQPILPIANTRIGGFGGTTGLISFLRQQQIDLLLDATHPFAAQISDHAAAAASLVGIPRLMLIRPPWQPLDNSAQGGLKDHWIEVDSHEEARTVLPGLAERIFLTIGRQELSTFAPLQDLWFLMRMIEPPDPNRPIPPGRLLLQRGPFSLVEERSLLQQYEIGAIVSKNSGGEATYAKIRAARELGLPVVMVQRPPVPEGQQVADLEDALGWLRQHGHS